MHGRAHARVHVRVCFHTRVRFDASRLLPTADCCLTTTTTTMANSDGFPLVPPTPQKTLTMLATVDLPSQHELGKCPPSLRIVTVEKAAICAVMAGCAPAHFRVRKLIPDHATLLS